MSTSTATGAERLRFNKALLFPGGQGAAGLEMPSAGDPEVLAALARNTRFPDRDIALGSVELKADGGRDFVFGDAAAKVSFKGSGSAFAGLGVYRDSAAALRALRFEDPLGRGLRLDASAGQRFLLLQWGYDASAAAKGAVALGYGAKATFGVDARSEGVFAVVRRIGADAPALGALESAVSSWRLPRQLPAADDLEPGTWIIAEVDGGIGVCLGAQFGYDFNWSRETALGGLKEDIGLRLELAVDAALGLEASGKYAVVVARPSDEPKLRLQVFKQSRNGLKFAFNAGAGVQASFSSLPANADDFIKAVFDVHGAQIIDDLHAIEKWTGPNTELSGPLAALGVDYARKLISEISGIEDPDARFDEARGRVLGLLKEWDNLPHRVATVVYKLVEQNRTEELDAVRAVSAAIAGGRTAELQALIGGELRKVAFFSTPLGRFLESLSTGSVLSLLTNSSELESARPAAAAAARLLDPSGLETTLRRLQSALLARLNLDQFVDPGKVPDAKALDQWLKLKIEQLIGRTIDSNERINDVRAAVSGLLAKRKEFYEKTTQALTRRYEAHFTATYGKATADTALIDAEFDFGRNAGEASALLSAALDGDFNALFTRESAAVQLNQAVLSHGITRSSHVEITLPRCVRTTDHLNKALAKVQAVQDGERLLVYELDASDTVTEKNRRNSRLAVAARLKTGPGIRLYSDELLRYCYSFCQVMRKTKRDLLLHQVRPYLERYFSGESIDPWISCLDERIDSGLVLLALELTVPAVAAGAWLDAPSDKNAPEYRDMSLRIQAGLKRMAPLYYFDDIEKYRDLGAAAPLLAYSAMPPRAEHGNPPHWDWVDGNKRNEMVFGPSTAAGLAPILQRAHDALVQSGFGRDAGYYEEDQRHWFCQQATTRSGDSLLRSLLFVEAEIVKHAYEAGRAIAKFREEGWKNPQLAVEELAKFGSAITEAFNKNMNSVYGGGALRPLGTMLFLEAASAFSPAAATAKPAGLFELTVLKQSAKVADLLNIDEPRRPAKDDILMQQLLASV